MAYSGRQHPNAALAPVALCKMVAWVVERGWGAAAAAERFGSMPRRCASGARGSRLRVPWAHGSVLGPHRSPDRTPWGCFGVR